MSYIHPELRRLVAARAAGLCEYCLIHEDDTYFGCEVDHVISVKHDGATIGDILAYACLPCNRSKGSDIASLIPGSSTLTRLFNPRIDRWADHFAMDQYLSIIGLTQEGEATVRILGLNEPDRLLERQELRRAGRYRSTPALAIVRSMRAHDLR